MDNLEKSKNLMIMEILNGAYGISTITNNYESFKTEKEREKRIEELRKKYDNVEIKGEAGIAKYVVAEKFNCK